MSGILLIIGAIVCVAILFFSSRVTWRFYQGTDSTNRLLLRVFVVGVGFLVISSVLVATRSAQVGLVTIAGLIAYGALFILIARELWGVLRRVQLIRAVNTLAEPEAKDNQ